MGRSAPQRLAIDAAAEAEHPHPWLLSTAQLRAGRDQLAELFASAPRDQRRRYRQVSEELDQTAAKLEVVESRAAELNSWLASHGRGLAGWARRDAVQAARVEHSQLAEQHTWLADKQAALEQLERQLARAERQRAAWVEVHTADRDRAEMVTVELGWRLRARGRPHDRCAAMAGRRPRRSARINPRAAALAHSGSPDRGLPRPLPHHRTRHRPPTPRRSGPTARLAHLPANHRPTQPAHPRP